MAVEAMDGRIMLLRTNAKPQPMTFVQVYMPTTTADDEVVHNVYAKVQAAVNKVSNKDLLVVLGAQCTDWCGYKPCRTWFVWLWLEAISS